jgi:Tfp pilus assembly protein PilN
LTSYSLAELISAKGAERTSTQRLQRLEARRKQLSESVDALNRELGRVPWRKLQTEAKSLQGVVASRRLVWSQMLADLERVVPWDARLVTITPQIARDGTVELTLSGHANNRESWLKLIAVLFTDPHFSEPLPQSEDTPESTGGQGYRFQLSVRYWPEGRA